MAPAEIGALGARPPSSQDPKPAAIEAPGPTCSQFLPGATRLALGARDWPLLGASGAATERHTRRLLRLASCWAALWGRCTGAAAWRAPRLSRPAAGRAQGPKAVTAAMVEWADPPGKWKRGTLGAGGAAEGRVPLSRRRQPA